MFASIEGMVVSTTENEYKGVKQISVDILQKCEGHKSVVATARMPNDGRVIPVMGTDTTYFGFITSFGANMTLNVA